MNMRGRKYKKPVRLWWDFQDDYVIVETDHPDHPIVERIKFNPEDGFGCAASAIQMAQKIIDDVNAGRKTLKSLLT